MAHILLVILAVIVVGGEVYAQGPNSTDTKPHPLQKTLDDLLKNKCGKPGCIKEAEIARKALNTTSFCPQVNEFRKCYSKQCYIYPGVKEHLKTLKDACDGAVLFQGSLLAVMLTAILNFV